MSTTARTTNETIVRIEAEGGQRLADLDRDRLADGVLIGGFGATLEEFVALTDALGKDWSDYRGGGFRFGALDRASVDPAATVMTATGKTQEFPVPLHGELYYFAVKPRLLWFMCETPPPDGGGETTICDGADLLEALPAPTREFLTDRAIVFHRRLAGDEWRQSFMTDDIDEVRRICAANATEVAYDPSDDVVRTAYRCSAVIEAPDGRPAFVTSLLPIYYAEVIQRAGKAAEVLKGSSDRTPPMTVRTDDGQEIPAEVIGDLMATGAELETAVTWRRGDIVVVDNARVLHGRAPSSSPERMVYVRMGEPRFAV
jgi:alpha-ketoglutarate-dependent taurine dioxygenase